MKALMINPIMQTITEVEYDGTPAGLLKLFPYNTICRKSVNEFGDYVLFNPNGLDDGTFEKDGAWGVYCETCEEMHGVGGMAFVYGNVSTEDQVLNDPHLTAEKVEKMTEWATKEDLQKEDPIANLLKLIVQLGSLQGMLAEKQKKEEEDKNDPTLH